MIKTLHDPICTILPQFLGFLYMKSCRVYIINSSRLGASQGGSAGLQSSAPLGTVELSPYLSQFREGGTKPRRVTVERERDRFAYVYVCI